MNSNIRVVPIQQLCVACGDELQVHDTTYSLASWLCRACMRLLGEQMFRELEQRTKDMTQNNISNVASHSWQYRVVPVAVKFLSLDTNGGEVLIRDFDACWIPVLVQFGLDR